MTVNKKEGKCINVDHLNDNLQGMIVVLEIVPVGIIFRRPNMHLININHILKYSFNYSLTRENPFVPLNVYSKNKEYDFPIIYVTYIEVEI